VSAAAGRVAVVFGSDPAVGRATAPSPRLAPVFAALAELGLAVEPVGYGAVSADEIRARLIAADGVLAWVDPVGPYGDRVSPFPPEAVPLLALATADAVAAVRTGRL
jgi:hypothetical protein